MKVAIVTDTNSGMLKDNQDNNGIYVIPMPFMIDGETYYEGKNMTEEQFYSWMSEGKDISTSQPGLMDVTDLWDKLLEEYDQIVHIPMSSGLSGSYQSAYMLADDYDGKVEVVNNQRVSVTQMQSALDAKAMADHGMSAKQIREILEDTRFDSSIYITLDTLKYLKKGGRITAAAAALGTLLKIKPVLTVQGEKLDAHSKARTMKQAKTTMIASIQKDMETRFGGADPKKLRLHIAHTNNYEAAMEFKKEVEESFPEFEEVKIHCLSLSIATHLGPGTLALACTKNLEY